MIYDLPTFDPPALLAGEPIRRKRRNRTTETRSRSYAPAIAIGMIFLLNDGTLCRVVQVTPEPLCLPIQEQDR